jgi:hypothetical protein
MGVSMADDTSRWAIVIEKWRLSCEILLGKLLFQALGRQRLGLLNDAIE